MKHCMQCSPDLSKAGCLSTQLGLRSELGPAAWTPPVGAAPAGVRIAEAAIGSVGTVISIGIVWSIERRCRIFGRVRVRLGAGAQNQSCQNKRHPRGASKQEAPGSRDVTPRQALF